MPAASAFVAIRLAVSTYGRIPLGKVNERPEFRTSSWIAMMFSVGLAIAYGTFRRRRQLISSTFAPLLGRRGTESGTQNYADGFYLPVKPHKTGQSKNGPPPPIGPLVNRPAAPVWAATGSRSPPLTAAGPGAGLRGSCRHSEPPVVRADKMYT